MAARAAGFARDALAWMIEDGAATAVDVGAEWTGRGRLMIAVGITLPDGAARDLEFLTELERR